MKQVMMHIQPFTQTQTIYFLEDSIDSYSKEVQNEKLANEILTFYPQDVFFFGNKDFVKKYIRDIQEKELLKFGKNQINFQNNNG